MEPTQSPERRKQVEVPRALDDSISERILVQYSMGFLGYMKTGFFLIKVFFCSRAVTRVRTVVHNTQYNDFAV